MTLEQVLNRVSHLLIPAKVKAFQEAVELAKRRYAVYGFDHNIEYYNITDPDTPNSVFGDLDDAIRAARGLLEERHVACVIDRMTDEEVWDSEAIKEASEHIGKMIQPLYRSQWQMFNEGVISLETYNKLKNISWETLSPIVNQHNATKHLTDFINGL